jgi:plastocyanin
MLTTKRRRLAVIGLGVLVALTVATFTLTPLSKLINDPADGPAVRASEVVVEDQEFNAPAIEVDAGTTVTWTFQDDDGGEFVAHNVVFDHFRSPDTTQGVYEHRFDEPGTYRYHCDLHFLMNGRVDVVAYWDDNNDGGSHAGR